VISLGDVSLSSDFISENSLEIFWISQLISRGTYHRNVTGYTTNEYKKKGSPVGLRKILISIFTYEKAKITYNCQYEVSLVLHMCKRTCATAFKRWFRSETYFLELKGIDENNTFQFKLLFYHQNCRSHSFWNKLVQRKKLRNLHAKSRQPSSYSFRDLRVYTEFTDLSILSLHQDQYLAAVFNFTRSKQITFPTGKCYRRRGKIFFTILILVELAWKHGARQGTTDLGSNSR